MIPEYHPYCSIYRTTPQLYKFPTDFGNGYYDNKIFQKDMNYSWYIQEKQKSKYLTRDMDYKYSNEINEIRDYISQITYYAEWYGYQLQEDYTIHKVEGDTDKLIYYDFSLPGFWNPEESLGKSLLTLHEPVPKISFPQKTLQACTKSRFVRFVWSIVHEKALNFHPSLPIKEFDLDKPEWYIRIERQVIIGFPELSCFLFVVKPFIVEKPKIKELNNTIRNMSLEQKEYKRITPELEKYLGNLSRI